MRITNFTELRNNLKQILEESSDQHEPVFIKRPKQSTMVMLPLEDYEALKETAYLLSTRNNAEHLRQSLHNAQQGRVSKGNIEDE